MPSFKVKVKWGKEVFNDIELNTDMEPVVFKAQLYALTGVDVQRQKVVFKGKVVGDDQWNVVGLKDGATLLMMGTAESVPSAPKEKVVFVEDMTESQLASALKYPAGLTNLGNSCYMNATVQCLKTVPELSEALKTFQTNLLTSAQTDVTGDTLTAALRDLYETMEKNATVTPIIMLQVLHLVFPRFAEKGEQGRFMQQDANECWTELMRILQQKLKPLDAQDGEKQKAKYSSFVEQYFGGRFDVTMKCVEDESEPEAHSTEDFLQMSCFITSEIKYLQSGLRSRLSETLTKFSPKLGRDSQYVKTSKISRLPAYLTIQFVRFFFKEQRSINAKILKDIKFTMNLDMFELCTEELQEKLIPMRTLFKEHEDKQLVSAQKGKPAGGDESKEATKKRRYPFSFPDDVGSNNSGYYELQGVLTHKGRSSSDGHYVAWIRRKADEWFKCDDDEVSLVTPEDILKLSGGGDWHCAYVLLYGPRILEVDESEQ